MQVVVEIDSAIVAIKQAGRGKQVVVLLRDKILLLDSSNGSLLFSSSLAKYLEKKTSTAIDFVYLEAEQVFIVAISENGLVSIPQTNNAASSIQKFSAQPRILLLPTSQQSQQNSCFMVCCDDGHVCQMFLSEGHQLATPPQLSAPSSSSSSSRKGKQTANNDTTSASPVFENGGELHAACMGPSSLCLAITFPPTPLKAGVSIVTWPITQTVTPRWLARETATVSPHTIDAESVLHLFAPIGQAAMSAVVMCGRGRSSSTSSVSSTSGSGAAARSKWVKLSADGAVLCERAIPEIPHGVALSAVGDGAILWLITSSKTTGNTIRALDCRYGTQALCVTDISRHQVTGLVAVIDTDTPTGSGGAAKLLIAVTAPGGGSAMMKRQLVLPSISLAAALGAMAPVPSAQVGPSSTTRKEKSKGLSPLSSLPPTMKRKLQDACKRNDEVEKLEAEGEAENVDSVGGPDLDSEPAAKKRNFSATRKPMYIDVSIEASRAFLSQLELASAADLLASDWDVIRALVRAGIVSLSSNPSLPSQALSSHRVDVLAMIARFVPDLGEADSVWLLKQCVNVPDTALARLTLVDGVLCWGAPVVSTNNGSTPKKRQTGKKGVASTGVSHLDLVRVVAEALLVRTGAFSSVLLGEAIRSNLSSAATALLLRVFVHMLSGLCAPVNLGGSGAGRVHLGLGFRDRQVSRAVAWAEGLLDAHFTATALNLASNDQPTMLAIQHAMQTVQAVRPASQSVEALIGLWTHMTRAVVGANDARPAPGASYRVETLRF